VTLALSLPGIPDWGKETVMVGKKGEDRKIVTNHKD
jgi:hypothetical protein